MKGRLGDLLIGFFVVAVTALFLMPIPTPILDILLVFNLGFSVMLLLVVLFVSEPAKLFVFPAVLLVSTLFRLGLNVASTRLILLDGYAGDVIQSFGQFLVRGEVIVGLVIFAIITVVNYIVVAKGASRVAEVAARFTLDGLPVKQMAIESDMRAGLITNQEAMTKREELRRESQLYGSMDGAMKFIQGDVIAGILIIFTNIFGGLYLGISSGMGFSEAAQTYTILTIGDGLVSQIPSLMGAFCAGIVVTRVSSGLGQTLSGEMLEQIFARKEAWVISSLIMLALAFAPGTPAIPFIVAALAFLFFANFIPQRYAAVGAPSGAMGRSLVGISNDAASRDIRQITARPGFQINFDSKVFGSSHVFESSWSALKVAFKDERGVALPELVGAPQANLPFGGFEFSVEGTEVLKARVPADCLFLPITPEAANTFGISVVEPAIEPVSGILGSWVRSDRTTELIVEAAGIDNYSQVDFSLRCCAAYLIRNAEKLISVADCFSIVKTVSQKDPGLVAHVIDSGALSVPKLAEVLQTMAREGLYIGNIRSILEDVASLFAKVDQPKDSFIVIEDIVAAIKSKRIKEVLNKVTSVRGGVRVITVGPKLRQDLEQAVGRDDHNLILNDRTKMAQVIIKMEELLVGVRHKGLFPVAICCEAELRALVSSILREKFYNVPVISSAEAALVGFTEELGVWEI